eukprot:gene25879-biopygen19528
MQNKHWENGSGRVRDASGTRPFPQVLSCGTRPGRVRNASAVAQEHRAGPDGIQLKTVTGRALGPEPLFPGVPAAAAGHFQPGPGNSRNLRWNTFCSVFWSWQNPGNWEAASGTLRWT